jgi:hypothetical protein
MNAGLTADEWKLFEELRAKSNYVQRCEMRRLLIERIDTYE